MVAGNQSALLFAVLEQRKLRHPKEAEIVLAEQPKSLRDLHAKRAQSRKGNFVVRVSHDKNDVAVLQFCPLYDFSGLFFRQELAE